MEETQQGHCGVLHSLRDFRTLALFGVADLEEGHPLDTTDAMDFAAGGEGHGQCQRDHTASAGAQDAGDYRIVAPRETRQGHATALPIAQLVDELGTAEPGKEERLHVALVGAAGCGAQKTWRGAEGRNP